MSPAGRIGSGSPRAQSGAQGRPTSSFGGSDFPFTPPGSALRNGVPHFHTGDAVRERGGASRSGGRAVASSGIRLARVPRQSRLPTHSPGEYSRRSGQIRDGVTPLGSIQEDRADAGPPSDRGRGSDRAGGAARGADSIRPGVSTTVAPGCSRGFGDRALPSDRLRLEIQGRLSAGVTVRRGLPCSSACRRTG